MKLAPVRVFSCKHPLNVSGVIFFPLEPKKQRRKKKKKEEEKKTPYLRLVCLKFGQLHVELTTSEVVVMHLRSPTSVVQSKRLS